MATAIQSNNRTTEQLKNKSNKRKSNQNSHIDASVWKTISADWKMGIGFRLLFDRFPLTGAPWIHQSNWNIQLNEDNTPNIRQCHRMDFVWSWLPWNYSGLRSVNMNAMGICSKSSERSTFLIFSKTIYKRPLFYSTHYHMCDAMPLCCVEYNARLCFALLCFTLFGSARPCILYTVPCVDCYALLPMYKFVSTFVSTCLCSVTLWLASSVLYLLLWF